MDETTWLMQALGDKLVALSRARINGGSGGRAAAAISVSSVGPTHVTVTATPPASYLITGWAQKPMTWLLGKVVAFTPKGQTERIIRTVSAKSLSEGKWVRPKRAPNDVFEDAMASSEMQSELDALLDLITDQLSPPQMLGTRMDETGAAVGDNTATLAAGNVAWADPTDGGSFLDSLLLPDDEEPPF